jgi:hypothetical protein
MAIGFYVVTYASEPNDKPWTAEILCYENQGPPPSGVVGSVRFYRDPAAVPVSASVGTPAVPVVNFPLSSFSDVMSIFRNELAVGANRFFGDTPGGTWDVWGVSGASNPGKMRP